MISLYCPPSSRELHIEQLKQIHDELREYKLLLVEIDSNAHLSLWQDRVSDEGTRARKIPCCIGVARIKQNGQ